MLVTGAGASRNLGLATRFPLMADWSEHLRTSFDSLAPRVAEAVGLRIGMRGDEFETALGRFLEFESSIPIMQEFQLFGSQPPMTTTGPVREWMDIRPS